MPSKSNQPERKLSIFDPEPFSFAKIAPEVVREMYPEGVPENVEITILGRSPITSRTDLREGYIPMQRAIVYLFENSWRAGFCKMCNRRFVKAQPKSEFCEEPDQRGEFCLHKASTQRKLEWWNKHGKQWRKKRRATRATKTRGS